jgi:quinohemoprotein ethanol dehydrogenase
VDPSRPYSITGAPRVVDGSVIIGNGGAEFGVRGYVSAYDAASSELRWRFYTVPGDPAAGFEQPELEWAAETWHGEWWRLGGGGTVWDSLAYDPDLDLLYVGVGNGSPWNRSLRSPGGGDNLFLASIVALRPADGRYVWHYQTTPGETWDYTATQHMIVADLELGGAHRRVLMQAPKNGFFYVLDAATGALLAAEPFVPVTWASRIDLVSGRPLENPAARYDDTGVPALVTPGPSGAHNWHPMAFSPRTGLVYLSATRQSFLYAAQPEPVVYPRGWNVGIDAVAVAASIHGPGATRTPRETALVAWDPVAGRAAWQVPLPHGVAAGALATAGGLVFQGNAAGELVAYRASNGERLWSAVTQAITLAAPVTYAVAGRQYVAVVSGGETLPAEGPGAVGRTTQHSTNNSRLLVYALEGRAELPAAALPEGGLPPLAPPVPTASAAVVARGERLYEQLCAWCHGFRGNAAPGSAYPDLRRSALLHGAAGWDAVVLEGQLAARGMASFAPSLTAADADAVRHYLIGLAHAAALAGHQPR